MAVSRASDELEPWRDLIGTVVMVTGASSGIGWELCIDLAKAGCRIVAAARRTDRLKSLCDEINKFDIPDGQNGIVRAMAVELDVSADGSTIEASVLSAWNAFGCIDALINNAGIRGPVRSPLDLSEEDWDKTFRTNLTGSWLVSKYVCLKMCASNKGGSIINISSTAGLNGGHLPGGLAYCSSKSALNTMTKVMAMELGTHKLRVNSISPGIFKSEITEKLMQKNWLKNVVSKTMPLKKLGTTDPALTSLVRYLIHGSSQYVTDNPVHHQRTKHIEIDLHFVRDLVARGHVCVLHVPTTSQYADIFTKGLPTSLFRDFVSSLNVRSPSDVQTAGGC